MSLYELRHLVRRYGENTALSVERLDIEAGSIVGITGHNGSGKSTLLRLMAFLEDPDEGEIRFQGTPTNSNSRTARLKATLLLQAPYLLAMSVRSNVAYGLKIRGISQVETRVDQALDMVGLDPKKFGSRKRFELSGGEAQRVALASRLSFRPEVLLMDEPTSNLDPKSAELIHQASLMARAQWGTTLVIVSHALSWLESVSDRILTMVQGRIAKDAWTEKDSPSG